MKRVLHGTASREVLITLLLSSGVSIFLLSARMIVSSSTKFWFLSWNLFLAWIPLGFAYWLYVRTKKKAIPDWKDTIIGFFWLGFLPNSFYLISDLIHIQSSGEVSILYDTAMMISFVLNGLLLGYISLFIVHRILAKYSTEKFAYFIAQFVLLLCSFAIYLGRYLRWNTWDVFVNPAGLLFDVSDRVINPGSHSLTFVVTGVFFIVLGSTYAVIYRLTQLLVSRKP